MHYLRIFDSNTDGLTYIMPQPGKTDNVVVRRHPLVKANRGISLGISALIVIALILIVGFGVYLNATLNPTLNTTYTKATDITVIPSPPFTPSVVCTNTTAIQHATLTCTAIATSSSSSGSLTTTYCVVPDTGYVYLQIVSSSGVGLGNISVLETPKANSCFGYPPFPSPTEQQTNATGYVAFGGLQSNYYYLISLNYSGSSYNFTLPQGPGENTMATYSVPAGSLSILLCTPQPYLCNSYTSATYTNTPQVTTSISSK